MIVYRIAPERFAHDLSGTGAKLYGGRWNPVGTPMLYAANSTALALLEGLVNVRQQRLPAHRRIVLELPDELIDSTDTFSTDVPITQAFGQSWVLENSSLGMRVRSSILVTSPDAFNILVNPKHPDFGQVKLLDNAPLEIDTRLIR